MYLGIDIGSLSIKYAVIDSKLKVQEHEYFRTHGDIISATKKLLKKIKTRKIKGIGVTGSGRKFIKALIDADIAVDEITTHRKAVKHMYPDVRTIFEIGGQDSKIIYFNENSVNFEMNAVCAAGTGSFLDQQADRLKMDVEDFYKIGIKSKTAFSIASKCTVFAESDMIHAQQSGIPLPKIIRGVHRGMVNNYFNQLCRGKSLEGKFLFEGGTSENKLLIKEFQYILMKEKLIQKNNELVVPKKYNMVMGAIGAAMMCISKGINNQRSLPQIRKYEFISTGECFKCKNKCGAKTLTFRINGKKITLGRACQE